MLAPPWLQACMKVMGLVSAPSLLCGFGKVASSPVDERGVTDKAPKEQSPGARAAYIRGHSLVPPDSIIPRITPSSHSPALRCTEAQLDFGGKDSKDTRRALRRGR